MLENVKFTDNDNGSIILSNDISIKLCDFGVAEIFNKYLLNNHNHFECNKAGLTIENDIFQAPNVYNGDYYDARKADMWQYGMIFYQCITGTQLYKPKDMWFEPENGYRALKDGELKKWLKMNNLLKYFVPSAFDILNQLLTIDEDQRISANGGCTHPYFKLYWNKYEKLLTNMIMNNMTKLRAQFVKMSSFPYYQL